MDFFLELFLTAVIAVLLLLSLTMSGDASRRGNDPTSDQAEIRVGDGSVNEELRFSKKLDASVLHSQRKFRVVDENVEPVDRFRSEALRLDHQLQQAAISEESVISNTEAESSAVVREIIVRDRSEPEPSDSAEELMVRTTEAESTTSVPSENALPEETTIREQEERSGSSQETSACVENEERGDVSAAESEEVRVEETENKMELNSEEDSESVEESKEELIIEEDDDWEGIERSELEKAFASTAKLLENDDKAENISDEAKMELYGLHKIATEGSCREAQPMAIMVSARAKWNAWQKLGNMSQEDAMEQYLALVSKEIPDLMNTSHTVGKMPEIEASAVLPPNNSGSLKDPTNLDTTGVGSSKNGEK